MSVPAVILLPSTCGQNHEGQAVLAQKEQSIEIGGTERLKRSSDRLIENLEWSCEYSWSIAGGGAFTGDETRINKASADKLITKLSEDTKRSKSFRLEVIWPAGMLYRCAGDS